MTEFEKLKFKSDNIQISEEYYTNCKKIDYNINDFDQIIKDLKESDPLKQLKGLVGLRKLYSQEKEKEEPKQLYNEINDIFNFLENYPEEFKYESLICIECIEKINKDNDLEVINEPNENIIKIILYILDFPYKFKYKLLEPDLNYIYLLVLYNKFAEKIGLSNLYIKLKNIIEKQYSDDINIIKKTFDIFSIIFKDNDLSEITQYILDLIPLINDTIKKYESNPGLLKNCLLLLSVITSGNTISTSIMNKVIDINILPKLIKYMDLSNVNENRDKIFYSLRIIGNFACMEESIYTDKIIEIKSLDILKELLDKKYPENIRTEVSWIISNIAAGTQSQLNKLYENNIQDVLIDIILNGNENKIKNNCLWALYNYSNLKNNEYLDNMIEKSFMDIIINRFKYDNGNTLACSLEALHNLLDYGKTKDPAVFNVIESKLNELDILNELRKLLNKDIEEVCENGIIKILTRYFEIEDIDKFKKDNNDES